MKIAIMQPYFFPYIGYFQLINSVDEFIIYDNIEYTKKGWINRNRIIANGHPVYISLTLKKDSDYLFVKDRYLSSSWPIERKKMLNRIYESYHNAPFFHQVFPLIEECILYDENNLFNYIYNSIQKIMIYIDIKTKLIISSNIDINHQLKSENKVIEICKKLNSDNYINAIGGQKLYNKDNFIKKGISLNFLESNDIYYNQFGDEFFPCLSIIDVLMFNNLDDIHKMLKCYKLI